MPTTTKYIWDDDNYLAEADGSDTINVVYTNEPQQYGNLISTRISSTTSYHHFDAIVSTRQLTDRAGKSTDAFIYDGWGNLIVRTGNTVASMQWIGELGYYWDIETGRYLIRRRTYSPMASRFTSRDPKAYFGVLSNLLTEYFYVKNRALLIFDPSGLECCGSDEPQQLKKVRKGDDIKLLKGQKCSCAAYEIKDGQFPGGDEVLFVNCYRGLMVPDTVPGANPTKYVETAKKCKFYDCLAAHEQNHIAEFKQFCPDACKDATDKGKNYFVGWSADPKGNTCTLIGECFSYAVGIECLIKRACEVAKEHKDDSCDASDRVCKIEITSLIESHFMQMNANCKAASLDGTGLVSNLKDWEKLKAGEQCGGG
jgi:RHS repeat-associated protein